MKRGASGLSLVVGIDKPTGLSSHDVVNRVRRIFGERRVGHTGTLDPLASGVLPVCIGPATRLDAYMVGHSKTYRAHITFGASTTTDDVQGETISTGIPAPELFDENYARRIIAGMVGVQKQMPPAYSAIKIGGRKACDEARKGHALDLQPREIEIISAELESIRTLPALPFAETQTAPTYPVWEVTLRVSSGTYIRSIARDMGETVGCPAHISVLRRMQAGMLALDACVTLEVLEASGCPESFAIDPVALLGYRLLFADERQSKLLANGNAFSVSDTRIFDVHSCNATAIYDSCTSSISESVHPLEEGELVSVVDGGTLRALYRFDQIADVLKPACVFSTGVQRG